MTYYLITYDIASPQRLRRVAMICKNYGVRIQKSVFECHLDKETFKVFWHQLCKLTHQGDVITAYPICASCLKEIRQTVPRIQTTLPRCYIF